MRTTTAVVLALFIAVAGWQWNQRIDRECIRATGAACGEAVR